MYYASSHYLATSGKMKFYINNKTYVFEKVILFGFLLILIMGFLEKDHL